MSTGTPPSAPAPRRDRDSSAAAAADTPTIRRMRWGAAALLGLEALGLAAVATRVLIGAAAPTGIPRLAVPLAVFILLFAAAAALAARSVLAGTRFGIGYGITWQLFQALVAANMLSSSLMPFGLVGMALAILTFILLLRIAQARAREEVDRSA